MDLRSNYPIWKDDVPKVEIFLKFKRKVNTYVDASSMHQSVLLPEVAPEVEQQMIAMKTTGFEDHITSMYHRLDATDNGVQRVYSLIKNTITGVIMTYNTFVSSCMIETSSLIYKK